eukprot:gnl/TRDRNA2_/TRDRNA2_167523_c0_seq1.p1 gnl/TRDRNA2_/TRDRNA2_167523_c0~~gnl/TRDRNA2_/TRDRNA2_167523_c0_seq1.p1  ORF type:complete len:201 (-),score=38.16 gnl/TRDRNA2_/TRDRNA2_167523_c0_seq1:30-632(-)
MRDGRRTSGTASGDGKQTPVTSSLHSSMFGERLGDGVRICILTGSKFNGGDTEQIVKAVAKELSAAFCESAVFLTGGLPGPQECFARSCLAEARVFNVLPHGQASNYGVGEDLHVGMDSDEQNRIFSMLGDAYITFEGGQDVSSQAAAAFARGAAVVPLIRTGGASSGMYRFPTGAMKKPHFITQYQWEAVELFGKSWRK